MRGGESKNGREATRERERCNTSNKGRVRERRRESDNDREATRERDLHPTQVSKEE